LHLHLAWVGKHDRKYTKVLENKSDFQEAKDDWVGTGYLLCVSEGWRDFFSYKVLVSDAVKQGCMKSRLLGKIPPARGWYFTIRADQPLQLL